MNVRSLLLGLMFFVGGNIGHGATALVSDDAFTSTQRPSVRRGGLPVLSVGPRETSYIKFDLSALPDGLVHGQIAKATLRLWVERVTQSGTVKVFAVDGDWSEVTISGALTPALAATESGTITLLSARQKYYVTLDVTALVEEWVTGDRGNDGIAIKSSVGSGAVKFDSKENMATSHEPTLEIVLMGTDGEPGAQGLIGPQGDTGTTGPEGPAGAPGTPANAVFGSVSAFPTVDTPPASSFTGQTFVDMTTLVTLPVQPFYGGRLVVTGERLFFVYLFTPIRVAEYSFETNEWTLIAASGGVPYSSAVCAGNDNCLYFFGGTVDDFYGSSQDTVHKLDLATLEWTTAPAMPSKKAGARAYCIGSDIYVVGGNTTFRDDGARINSSPSRRVCRFTTSTQSWQQMASLPDTYYFSNYAGAVGNGMIYLGITSKLTIYDPTLDQWSEKEYLPIVPSTGTYGDLVQANGSIWSLHGGFRIDLSTEKVTPEAYFDFQSAVFCRGYFFGIDGSTLRVAKIPPSSFLRWWIKR